MGYTLVQLRPHPSLLEDRPGAAIAGGDSARRGPATIWRWLFLYLPVMAALALVVYAALELLLKQLALVSFRREMNGLPDTPVALPPTATTRGPIPVPSRPASENGSTGGGSYF